MRNIDIVKPVKLPARIDWDSLYLEFLENDVTPSIQTFLRDVKGWPVGKVTSGNTLEHIEGWGIRRAGERQAIIDQRMQNARDSFADLMPQIQAAKRQIIADYIDMLQNGQIIRVRKSRYKWVYKRRRLTLIERSHILTKLKTELGEPAVITKNQVEDNGGARDPAMAVLIALGVFNGSEEPGTGRAGSAGTEAAPDSGQAISQSA